MLRKLFSLPLYFQTLVMLVAGAAVGLWVGRPVPLFGDVATLIIDLIKFLAIPLLFLAITDALLRREFKGSGLLWLFLVALLNGSLAAAIGLVISNVFHPGRYLPLKAPETASSLVGLGDKAMDKVVTSPMLGAIGLALLLGLFFVWGERHLGDARSRWLKEKVGLGLQGVTRWIGRAVHLVPLAVFASVAKVVGEHGFSMLGGLAAYLFACLAGMLFHVGVVYQGWVLGVAKLGFRRFWSEAREPVAHAFGINSSLATLPVTLRALSNLKVSPGAARLSACVGTNFNNDGILLYEVVAVLFLSQAYGLELDFFRQLFTVAICVVATIGVGGIPEAGIISLSLVLSAVHLPVEGIPILLTVDWILARCRSAVNVLGDMTVAVAIDHLDPPHASSP